MFCETCGSALQGTEQFCGRCGRQLRKRTASGIASGIMAWFHTRTDLQKLAIFAAVVAAVVVIISMIVLGVVMAGSRSSVRQSSIEEQFWGLIVQAILEEMS